MEERKATAEMIYDSDTRRTHRYTIRAEGITGSVYFDRKFWSQGTPHEVVIEVVRQADQNAEKE